MPLGAHPLGSAPLGAAFSAPAKTIGVAQALVELTAVAVGSVGVTAAGSANLAVLAGASGLVRIDATVGVAIPLFGCGSLVLGVIGVVGARLDVRCTGVVFVAPTAHGGANLPVFAFSDGMVPPNGRATAPLTLRADGRGYSGVALRVAQSLPLTGRAAVYAGRAANGAGTLRLVASAESRHGLNGEVAIVLPLVAQACATTLTLVRGDGVAHIRLLGVGYAQSPTQSYRRSIYVHTRQDALIVRTR